MQHINQLFFSISFFFSSRVRSAPAEEQTDILDLWFRGLAVKHWAERRHVLLAGLLNLCTLITLSTLPVRPSPPSEEHHPAPWPVSYVWLCFWSELSKNFPSETPMLFHYIKERVRPAHHSSQPSVSLSVGWEFRRRSRPQATWLSLFTIVTIQFFFPQNALIRFRHICI